MSAYDTLNGFTRLCKRSSLPAQTKCNISAHSWHDNLMVWILEYKARGRQHMAHAPVCLHEPSQNPQECGLPTAVRAHQHVEGTSGNLQADIGEHLQSPLMLLRPMLKFRRSVRIALNVCDDSDALHLYDRTC